MSVIYILVGASITVAIGFLVAFLWSVKTGQYDDDYTPSVRILFDDLPAEQNQSTIHSAEITSENKKQEN